MNRLFLVVIAFFATSCATYHMGNGTISTSPVYPLTQNNIVKNGKLETDLEMIGEVAASITIVNEYFTFKGNYVLGEDLVFGSRENKIQYEKLKSAVLYEAITKAGCDIILAPIYTISIAPDKAGYKTDESEKGICTITVKGIGANIKGVRQIKTE